MSCSIYHLIKMKLLCGSGVLQCEYMNHKWMKYWQNYTVIGNIQYIWNVLMCLFSVQVKRYMLGGIFPCTDLHPTSSDLYNPPSLPAYFLRPNGRCPACFPAKDVKKIKKAAKLQTIKNQLHYSWTVIHTEHSEALLCPCSGLLQSSYLSIFLWHLWLPALSAPMHRIDYYLQRKYSSIPYKKKRNALQHTGRLLCKCASLS